MCPFWTSTDGAGLLTFAINCIITHNLHIIREASNQAAISIHGKHTPRRFERKEPTEVLSMTVPTPRMLNPTPRCEFAEFRHAIAEDKQAFALQVCGLWQTERPQ